MVRIPSPWTMLLRIGFHLSRFRHRVNQPRWHWQHRPFNGWEALVPPINHERTCKPVYRHRTPDNPGAGAVRGWLLKRKDGGHAFELNVCRSALGLVRECPRKADWVHIDTSNASPQSTPHKQPGNSASHAARCAGSLVPRFCHSDDHRPLSSRCKEHTLRLSHTRALAFILFRRVFLHALIDAVLCSKARDTTPQIPVHPQAICPHPLPEFP